MLKEASKYLVESWKINLDALNEHQERKLVEHLVQDELPDDQGQYEDEQLVADVADEADLGKDGDDQLVADETDLSQHGEEQFEVGEDDLEQDGAEQLGVGEANLGQYDVGDEAQEQQEFR